MPSSHKDSIQRFSLLALRILLQSGFLHLAAIGPVRGGGDRALHDRRDGRQAAIAARSHHEQTGREAHRVGHAHVPDGRGQSTSTVPFHFQFTSFASSCDRLHSRIARRVPCRSGNSTRALWRCTRKWASSCRDIAVARSPRPSRSSRNS